MLIEMNQLEEQLGKFSVGSSLTDTEKEAFLQEWNQTKAQAQQQREFELLMLKKQQEEQEALWEGKVIKPFGFYIMIKHTGTNPYLKKITSSGIITDTDGLFSNPDSGEMDMLEKNVCYAIAEDVGPDVKHIKKGDEIIYSPGRMLPLPFKDEGFCLITESQVFGVVGKPEDLNERF